MRERRTRKHQIEDLSYNFVERVILEAFCTMRRYVERDYSYDATVRTYRANGEPENGEFCVQVKATGNLQYSTKNEGYILKLEKRDLDLWLDEIYPVLIVLYDANNKNGYYIELHEYFKSNKLELRNIQHSKSVFIPSENEFSTDAVKKYQTVKNKIHERNKSI